MYEAPARVPWHADPTHEPHAERAPPLLGSRTYEISFAGRASPAVRAEFDDCQVTNGPDVTVLRAELPDQCALSGLIQRIIDLRLEITYLLLVSPPTP